jgi:hypothetical protein
VVVAKPRSKERIDDVKWNTRKCKEEEKRKKTCIVELTLEGSNV